MRPRLGVAHSDQQRLDMATAESAWSALLSCLAKSAKRFCALKDIKDSVCKWYPSLKVEVPAAFLLHVTRDSIFSNSSIILPGLRASNGVTRSYSSRQFLCSFHCKKQTNGHKA